MITVDILKELQIGEKIYFAYDSDNQVVLSLLVLDKTSEKISFDNGSAFYFSNKVLNYKEHDYPIDSLFFTKSAAIDYLNY